MGKDALDPAAVKAAIRAFWGVSNGMTVDMENAIIAYCEAAGVVMVKASIVDSARKNLEAFDKATAAPMVAMANNGCIALELTRAMVEAAEGTDR